MAVEYLVQEEDGTSRIVLEEGDGYLILEESPDTEEGGGNTQYRRRRRP